jgi:transcriptional regulator GlxA family with amidase domain
VELRAGARLLGLRFIPGAAGALLGVPASAVRDARVALQELWGEGVAALEERLIAAADARAALSVLEAAVLERRRTSPPVDPVAQAVARALRPSLDTDLISRASQPSVSQLSAALGVSERQLLRRCDAAFGYGPKLLARVLRFQSFVHALPVHAHMGLAQLALALGYTDQAHLAHDTAELAGQTPRQLRAGWAPE